MYQICNDYHILFVLFLSMFQINKITIFFSNFKNDSVFLTHFFLLLEFQNLFRHKDTSRVKRKDMVMVIHLR